MNNKYTLINICKYLKLKSVNYLKYLLYNNLSSLTVSPLTFVNNLYPAHTLIGCISGRIRLLRACEDARVRETSGIQHENWVQMPMVKLVILRERE